MMTNTGKTMKKSEYEKAAEAGAAAATCVGFCVGVASMMILDSMEMRGEMAPLHLIDALSFAGGAGLIAFFLTALIYSVLFVVRRSGKG